MGGGCSAGEYLRKIIQKANLSNTLIDSDEEGFD